jgi:outer membrane protein OmpA-like peptidoglycan-associated protein
MRYLTEHGVDASRLTSEGYGLTRPRATNDTDAGRAENRRVEFNIVERAPTGGETTP